MREFLISEGYGAGWSTWNLDYKEFLLFNKGLIELAKKNANESEVKRYLQKNGIYSIYMRGWEDIKVVTLEDNEQFIIEEYEGWESVRTKEGTNWL